MQKKRHRVNITLSEDEYLMLMEVSKALGRKPTFVAYMAMFRGLIPILKENEHMRTTLPFLAQRNFFRDQDAQDNDVDVKS